MKLEFILADTTEQAMKESLSRFSVDAKNDLYSDYLVLVPETKTLEAEQLLLGDVDATVNISVNSFDRLLEKLQYKSDKKPLTRETGIMLIRKIVYEMKDSLVCFKKSAASVGFIENIYDTIAQIKASGLTPEEFTKSTTDAKKSLKLKLQDISLIYDAYESELKNVYIDATDKLDILSDVISDNEKIKNSKVLVCGYDTLTSKAMDMMRSIVKTAKNTTVACSFMHPDSKNAHIKETEIFDKFKSLADSLHIKYEPVRIKQKYNSDLEHLKNNLFSYPPELKVSDGNIKLYNFQNVYNELDNICKIIKQKVSNGERYNNMAIVYPGLEVNKRIVEEKMKEYEIPYFIAKPYDFSMHPLFACIRAFFEMLRKNLEQSSVLLFVKNFFVNLPNKDEFENYCTRYGISYTKFLKPFAIIDEKQKETAAKAEECRKQFVSFYVKMQNMLKNAKTYSDYVKILTELLKNLQIKNQIDKLTELQTELNDNIAVAINDQVLDVIDNTFSSLITFLGDTKTTLEEFSLLLQSGLASSNVSLIPQTLDCLKIQQNGDGLSNIDDLFIMNAIEGNFPLKSDDCGIISDEEIAYLADSTNKKIEPTIRTINRRERFRTYELMLLPEKKLYISCSSQNITGDEEKPSATIGFISKIFFDGEDYLKINNSLYDYSVLNIDDDNFASFNPTPASGEKNFLQKLHYKQNYILSDQRVNDLYFALKSKGFSYDKIKEYNKEKNIYVDNADKLFFENGKASVSELEKYFACPFAHFVSFGLGIKEKQQSSFRAIDVGDILHALAEKYLRNLVSGNEKKPQNILDEILKDEKYNLEDNKIIIRVLKSESERICSALKKEYASSSFKPTYFEMWYGEKGKVGRLNIDETVGIEGKIDRVDICGDKLRVIDYKTGAIDAKASELYYGKKIQLLTYLCALEKLGKKPVASLYFPLHNDFSSSEQKSDEAYKMDGVMSDNIEDVLLMDNSISFENAKSSLINASISTSKTNIASGNMVVNKKDNQIDAENFEKLEEYTKKLIKKAVSEIKMGYIEASPYSNNGQIACAYCKYSNICGIKGSKKELGRKCNLSVTYKNIMEADDE